MPTITTSVDEVQLGPGALYVANIGVAAPSSSLMAASALASGWYEVGFTDEGSTFEIAQDAVGIPVAERFDPIKYVLQSVEYSLGFAMKQSSRRTLALALNQGVVANNDGTALEPLDPGQEQRVQILFYTESGARWYFRQCLQATNVSISRSKAPAVALLPVQFHVEKPDSLAPFTIWPTATGLV